MEHWIQNALQETFYDDIRFLQFSVKSLLEGEKTLPWHSIGSTYSGECPSRYTPLYAYDRR